MICELDLAEAVIFKKWVNLLLRATMMRETLQGSELAPILQ
jgi:hypothetical protein